MWIFDKLSVMEGKIGLKPFIALGRDHSVFRVTAQDRLVRVLPRQMSADERRISIMTTVEYYREPFVAMAAAKDETIRSQWQMNQFTFHLLSPFDYAAAVDRYLQGEEALPLALNVTLTDRCNFACQVCLNRVEREKRKPSDLPTEAYIKTLVYLAGKGGPLTHNISCGGSGEAILHPDFTRIVDFAHEFGVSTFFTTNGSRHDRRFIETTAKKASVAVFSFHGVYGEAFKKLCAPPGGVTYDRVMRTIAQISELRGRYGRHNELIIGILAMVHPGNAGGYENFLKRAIDIGVDYISLNPILPNPQAYGLKIAPEVEARMTVEFAALRSTFAGVPTYIRVPDRVFQAGDERFFDPRVRRYRDLCLVSLLQPSINPVFDRPGIAKVPACRFYPYVINDPELWYSDELGPKDFASIWTPANIGRIQARAGRCFECSSERQIMALDWMVHVRRTIPGAEYYLLFPQQRSGSGLVEYSKTVGGEGLNDES